MVGALVVGALVVDALVGAGRWGFGRPLFGGRSNGKQIVSLLVNCAVFGLPCLVMLQLKSEG